MAYRSSKTYGHDLGLSVCFRQWRANSHCNQLHGYALAIHLEFEAEVLDDRNWVVDFGGLKDLKSAIFELFDHTLLISKDDPERAMLEHLSVLGVAKVKVVPAVGCEAFATMVYGMGQAWLEHNQQASRVKLVRVDVREHGANEASYLAE
jgi:6-pyruvoyltetrahydropterin/6-carboxytetrahydropterin synthase